jgi:glycine/D-amino acid oxidase-like deaminating enzyme
VQVAVMGAGITGACVALELAGAGCRVDLFDRAPLPLSRASLNNEGKLHLGLTYAKDTSGRTAEMMIRGAVSFRSLLSRWLSPASLHEPLSTPFVYAVPRDSMLTPDEVRRHFERVSAIFELASREVGNPYVLPIEAPLWEQLGAEEFNAIFDPRQVSCAFKTQERAIDPTRLCAELRTALASAPRLVLRCMTTVEGVARDGRGRIRVRSSHAGQRRTESYDTVVNALWEQRLALDATLGLRSLRPIAHRYKVGLRTNAALVKAGLPSVSFVLGVFGDTVAYPDNAYVSWYPAGLLSQEFSLRPRLTDVELGPAEQARVIERTLEGLRNLMPGISRLLHPSAAEWEVVGGYITAWGRSGIEDAGSELHRRYAVGVTSHGNYHTIDTGKLTLGPLFAAEACARILHRGAACS